MELADLARCRQAAYRLLGGVLRYPTEERLRTLAAVARELEREGQQLAEFAFFPQWIRFLRALEQRDERTGAADLEDLYVRLFVVDSGSLCPPYASHYLAPETPGWILSEVEREYASSGVALAPSLEEPPDHIAVELEFLSFLCGEEAEAWKRRSPGAGVERLDREASFLGRHLGQWFPEFARRVVEQDGGSFYTVAIDAARTFIAHDLELVTALLVRYREVAGP